MDIVFYQSYEVWNKLVKSRITERLRVDNAQLRGEINDKNPEIEFTIPVANLNAKSVNYMAIDPGFAGGFVIGGSFYFIDSITEMRNGYIKVIAHMDLLMTYQANIRTLKVLVDRSTVRTSKRLADPMHSPFVTADAERRVLPFPNQIDDTESGGTYVLVTSQSGYTP